MTIGIRIVTIVFAVVCAGVVADGLAAYLAADACLDAGGRYDSATGACTGTAGYVAPFSRPGNTAFWLFFLTPIVGIVVGIYAVTMWILDRTLPDSEVGGIPRD